MMDIWSVLLGFMIYHIIFRFDWKFWEKKRYGQPRKPYQEPQQKRRPPPPSTSPPPPYRRRGIPLKPEGVDDAMWYEIVRELKVWV